MKKITSISALGFLILLTASPYIAISRDWKNDILMVGGLAIIVLSLLLRKELHKVIRIVHDAHEIKSDTYVENNPQ